MGRSAALEADDAEGAAFNTRGVERWVEVFEQGDHTRGREHRGEVLRPAGTLQRLGTGDLQVEDGFVEEEQGAKGLTSRRGGVTPTSGGLRRRDLAAGIRGVMRAGYRRGCAERRLPVASYPLDYRDRPHERAADSRDVKIRRIELRSRGKNPEMGFTSQLIPTLVAG